MINQIQQDMIYADNSEVTEFIQAVYKTLSDKFSIPLEEFPKFAYLNLNDNDSMRIMLNNIKNRMGDNEVNALTNIENNKSGSIYELMLEEESYLYALKNHTGGGYSEDYNAIILPVKELGKLGTIVGEEVFHFIERHYATNKKRDTITMEFFGYLGRNFLKELMHDSFNKMFSIKDTTDYSECVKIIEERNRAYNAATETQISTGKKIAPYIAILSKIIPEEEMLMFACDYGFSMQNYEEDNKGLSFFDYIKTDYYSKDGSKELRFNEIENIDEFIINVQELFKPGNLEKILRKTKFDKEAEEDLTLIKNLRKLPIEKQLYEIIKEHSRLHDIYMNSSRALKGTDVNYQDHMKAYAMAQELSNQIPEILEMAIKNPKKFYNTTPQKIKKIIEKIN